MEKVNIAVIGAGYWGKNIIRVCHELGSLVSVCDNNPEIAGKYANDYNASLSSWSDILNNSSINAVAIALPAQTHEQYIKEALDANKHVFVEKPLAMDVDIAHELGLLAQKKSKILMVGHILQYHTAYIKLKELISDGEIGNIKYIESTRLHLGPIRYNAGIIWELLPHDVSMLLGVCNSPIQSVDAHQQKIFNNNNNDNSVNFGDVININIKYSSGVLAKLHSSWLHADKEQKFWVAGDQGMLVFKDTENWDNKLKLFKYNKSAGKTNSVMFEQKIAITPVEPLKSELSHFVNAIKTNSSVITDAAEGIRVVSLLQNIESKLKTKSPEPVSFA